MRKLEKFEINELPISQQLNAFGGLLTTRSRCSTETCVENCADISTTWTRDEDDGTVISEETKIFSTTDDC
jgi:hypothetical protein